MKLDQSFRLIGMPGWKTADQIDAFEQRQIPVYCHPEQFKTIGQVIDVQSRLTRIAGSRADAPIQRFLLSSKY